MVKGQAAEYPVRNVVAAQVLFHDPALGIGAIQHGYVRVAQVKAVALLNDGIPYPLTFFGVAHGFDNLDLLSGSLTRPDFFLDLAFIEADYLVGSLHNVLGGTVVFFQFKDFNSIGVKVLFKIENILDGCPTEGVDTLRIVAHHTDIARTSLKVHQLADDPVLQGIGILKLVHHQVFETLAVLFQHLRVLLPQLVKAVQKVVEIHCPGPFATFAVFEVDFADVGHFGLPILHF